jgi:hypothetical protein
MMTFVYFIGLGLGALAGTVITIVPAYLLGEEHGRKSARDGVHQEAVDRGYGFWTVIAAVNTFQWGQPEDLIDDDAPPNADRAKISPSGEGPAATHDY